MKLYFHVRNETDNLPAVPRWRDATGREVGDCSLLALGLTSETNLPHAAVKS